MRVLANRPKAGVDAIHHAILFDHLGDHGGGGVDPARAAGSSETCTGSRPDAAQGGKIQLARG
jgi:hypothetical protein